jgi:hypothetical protein
MGLSTIGISVSGVSITGRRITGISVIGISVTGISVTGISVTGISVIGISVIGLSMTGAQELAESREQGGACAQVELSQPSADWSWLRNQPVEPQPETVSTRRGKR